MAAVSEALSGHADAAFEDAVRAALREGGYLAPEEQRRFPSLTPDRMYQLDMLTRGRTGQPLFIQLFYQGESGSAQERVPYLALRLTRTVVHARVVDGEKGAIGYLVLDGNGITDRDFFIQELPSLLGGGRSIRVVDKQAFCALAQAGQL